MELRRSAATLLRAGSLCLVSAVVTPLDAAAVRGGDHVLLLQQPERQPDPIVACGSIAAAGVEQG